MTDKALAARLREHANLHREHLPQDHEQQQWTADLERAADLIEKMAQPEPIATVYYPRTGGNVGVSWRAIPETGAMPPEGAKLYLAPPAQRVPLSDEQIYQVIEAARESYRAHTTGIRGQMLTIYDDMDWHLVRAVEQAHGIRSEK